jgi:hypothetical protein
MIRKWRADLLGKGVSVSMAAKAYRLLRAILATAVEEDKILPRNPCRVRGAGEEHAPERPVLTVSQVFDLSELVGRRPVGNIRKLSGGGYRLRVRADGKMRTAPGVYDTRAAAERALWLMAAAGRADFNHDGRFRALVLLATFASLRWGEVTALTRSDIDLKAGTVWIAPAFLEAFACRIRLTYHAFLPCVVVFLVFFRRYISACRVKPFRVIPGDPFQSREHDIIDPAPWPFPVDELLLVKTVQRLRRGTMPLN